MPFLASRASQTTISCFFMKAVFLRDACSCNKASSQTDRGLHHPPDTGGQGDPRVAPTIEDMHFPRRLVGKTSNFCSYFPISWFPITRKKDGYSLDKEITICYIYL